MCLPRFTVERQSCHICKEKTEKSIRQAEKVEKVITFPGTANVNTKGGYDGCKC